MTRHDMLQFQAAGAQPPATDPPMPVVISEADRATTSRVPGRQHRAETQRSGLSAFIPVLADDGDAIADISRRSKSP